jgi:hypothetical protein
VAPVVLTIWASDSDAKEASHGWGEIVGFRTATVGELGEKFTYEPRNTRFVAPGIAACSFHNIGIDSDVQSFLGHGRSYAHDRYIMIRMGMVFFKGEGEPREIG